MKRAMKDLIGFTIARVVASILLIWSLAKHPYGYYTALRFTVCGVTSFGTYLALCYRKIGWAWIFGLIAVLFNPFVPIHMSRSVWLPIDIAVAVVLITSIFLLRTTEEEIT